jgi:hypothetical protein
MDREFDSQHVLEMISQRRLSYVVPKRMQTSERARAKRLLQRDDDRYETERKLHLGNTSGTRRRSSTVEKRTPTTMITGSTQCSCRIMAAVSSPSTRMGG